MPTSITVDPARSAVLSMDYHTSIVSIYAREDQPALLARAANVLKTAR
jgi:6-phosphogluconolactonase (cycloisomerase 2 family)